MKLIKEITFDQFGAILSDCYGLLEDGKYYVPHVVGVDEDSYFVYGDITVTSGDELIEFLQYHTQIEIGDDGRLVVTRDDYTTGGFGIEYNIFTVLIKCDLQDY